ncbi:Vacuolar protein sorting-associated protein 13D [Halotydeus destructor]|nr:Vacuolar protein sorting-associated protein 13D [Halotydeus destructor]
MLERLLAWFINNYIGEYFDNVNIDQLSIAYRQGEIELENLPLKPGALKNFGFPVDVKSAWIGKIKIRGSYRIRSEPWTVTIEDLHVVCVPLTSFEYDLDQEELNAQTIKYGVLECMENKWKLHSKSSQETSYYASSYWTWLSYSSSLITSILENIHFNISNLHIRYEDTLPNKLNVACGFLVKNVSAFSSDSDWMPKFVNRTESSNCMRKVIQLTDLSVYWDSDVAFVSNDNGDWVKQMHDLFDFSVKSDMSVCDHFYFLSPVKAEAFICRNFSDEFDSIPKPKITFDFKIDQFVLTISFRQYKQMLYCLSEFNRCQILLKNRKWRPKKSISDEPKAWWKYAINVNLQNWRKKNRRENWNFVLKRAKMLTKYSKVYSEFLLQPDNLAEEAKNFKEEVEYELEFEELFRLRDASCRLSHSKEIVDAHAQLPSESWLLFSNWIPSWVYTGSSSTMEETPLEIVDDFFSSTDWEDLRFVSISAQIDKAMLKIVDDYNVHPCDLLTAKMSEMNMYQQMRGNDVDGNTRLTISSDYYNRNLQLWEPLVEPWIIDLTWIVELQKVKEDEFTKVIRFKLCSHQVLVMNVTCMSIDLYTRLSKFFASDPSREMRREEEQKVFSESVLVHYHLDVRFEALNLKLLKSGLDSVDRMLALASINGFRLESVLNQSEVKLNSSIKYIKLTEDVCNVRSEIRTVASIGDDKKSENSTLQAVSLTLKRSYADNVMDITFTVASSYYMHSSKLDNRTRFMGFTVQD